MVTARKAVESAEGFLRSIYSDRALDGLRIEEIEKAEDNTQWLVTLSFLMKEDVKNDSVPPVPPPLASFLASGLNRVYKRLRVAPDGEVESMRIGPL